MDDYCLVVVHNLRRAQKKWAWLTRLLGREVADAWTPGMFYNAVLQPVLLYGSEIWVMLPRIGRTLVGFHHRVVHILTGRQPWRVLDGA